VKKPTARLNAWAEAQKRFHLSDLHIQMARELGLNPKKCGGLATHRQEPWKLPLPECIAACYRKRLHRERPAKVVPLADVAKRQQPSARDKARHPRAHTDPSRHPGGNMPRVARRRLRSAPLCRSAILLWPCADCGGEPGREATRER
jgi:hypothetical protein